MFFRIRPRKQNALRGLLPRPRRRDRPGADRVAHVGAARAGARPALQAPAGALQQCGEARMHGFLPPPMCIFLYLPFVLVLFFLNHFLPFPPSLSHSFSLVMVNISSYAYLFFR